MKKYIIALSLIMALSMAGCSSQQEVAPTSQPSYTTKYITNTDKLDIREKPSNDASIICTVDMNTPVSFVEDSDNGYSKVVYNGVTGYALASYLTLEAPDVSASESDTSVSTANTSNTANTAPQSSSDSSIISHRSESEIEEYITSYVRPLYNEVNEKIDSYAQSTADGATCWSDSKGYIKKEFASGVNRFDMSREYYYDTDSGRIAFAFIYDGSVEHRLYFRTNQLVRYIGPDGVTVNNPTSQDVLALASHVLQEAY